MVSLLGILRLFFRTSSMLDGGRLSLYPVKIVFHAIRIFRMEKN